MAIDIETNLPGADVQDGASTWYGHMTRPQRNAFWSCKLGYILDAMEDRKSVV